MRFAYIDSQGNEVSIPSVDALALRIELGAIGPDTQLYDAQADRWGPAQTHEIFHTLSRNAAGDGGFVAPPPPVAPSEPDAGDAGADEAMDVSALEPDAPPPAPSGPPPKRFNVAEDLGLAPPEPETPEPVTDAGGDDAGDLGFDFTLTDPLVPADEPPSDLGGDAELTFAPTPVQDDGPDAAGDEGGGFDFGDLSTLELEGDAEEEPDTPLAPEEPAGGAMDFSGGATMDFSGGDEGAMDFSPGGMEGLDLEQPMSEFTPDSPPSWMEDSTADEDDGAMSFGGGAADDDDERPSPPTRRTARDSVRPEDPSDRPERPQPRSRPSPPRRTRRKSPAGLVGGLAALVVLGGGGYYVYTTFLQGGGKPEVAEPVALPPVTIPDIPAELLPRMRDLGEAALSGTIAQLNADREASGLPAEPNGEWLAGVYLARASQFRDVQEYWEGIASFVDHVRDSDTSVFHDQYVAQLEQAGITGDTASMLLARADSGFLATRDARFEVYAQMDDLVNAALDLHRFLLQHEPDIQYTPAAGGVSEDPVLEAVPATKELGDEMWSMVDRITSALDALGTLDKVTTERLSAVLFDRVRRAGFQ